MIYSIISSLVPNLKSAESKFIRFEKKEKDIATMYRTFSFRTISILVFGKKKKYMPSQAS